MSRGFFPQSELAKEAPTSLIAKCGACGLFKSCQTPKMPYSGKGLRKILIVGEIPWQEEDEQGTHFVGEAGQRLKSTLHSLGINMRTDCWLTNALICKSAKGKLMDERMVDYCRPNLIRTIKELQPVVIILLGVSAVRSLIADTWKENPGGIARWVGWNIPDQKYNAWICPTYHPTFLAREKDPIKDLLFVKHLSEAVEFTERPWKVTPRWEDKIEVILDSDKAARIIDEIEAAGGDCAGDYENTCLKPEYEGAEIVCCSICHEGKRTIAFPWHGAAIAAMRRAWHSKRLGWIASNLKHEDRWTFSDSGQRVRNWIWDTMLAAHTLDNREGITGLKFQSYVYLGMPAYDEHIKPLLRGVGTGKINQVKTEIALTQLLRYCGFDTLLEFKLARVQHRLMTERPRPHLFIPESSLHAKP